MTCLQLLHIPVAALYGTWLACVPVRGVCSEERVWMLQRKGPMLCARVADALLCLHVSDMGE